MKYVTPDTSNNKLPFKIAFGGHNLTNVTINFFPSFSIEFYLHNNNNK